MPSPFLIMLLALIPALLIQVWVWASEAFALRLATRWVRMWVRLLTAKGLPPPVRDERRREMDSDLAEHIRHALEFEHYSPRAVALQIVWRWLSGLPVDSADVLGRTYRREHRPTIGTSVRSLQRAVNALAKRTTPVQARALAALLSTAKTLVQEKNPPIQSFIKKNPQIHSLICMCMVCLVTLEVLQVQLAMISLNWRTLEGMLETDELRAIVAPVHESLKACSRSTLNLQRQLVVLLARLIHLRLLLIAVQVRNPATWSARSGH